MIKHAEGGLLTIPEKRYLPRWSVRDRVLYQLENQLEVMEGEIENLTCSGVCIHTKGSTRWNDFAAGQNVKISLYLSMTSIIGVNGRVMWVERLNEYSKEKRVGISFYNTSANIQDQLLEYALQSDREEIVRQWFHGWN